VLLPQAWTLSIELVLSLLLPVGLLLAGRGSSWLVFFGLLATSLLGVSIFLLHFLLGMTIARHYTDLTRYLSGRRWQRRLLLLAGLALYTCGSYVPSGLFGDTAVWLGSGLGAGLILMFVLGSTDAQTLLSQPVLRQIGKVSYSAYLSHMAILICVTPYVLKVLEGFTDNRLALWFGGWLITVACVQGISLCFYHWLEIPSMSLGRRVTDAIAAIGKPKL
jgi:peptidoglycan/LPS O-acetylase OafA/YrhL